MPYALLADLVTIVHLATVVFMLTGLLAIPIGGLRGWRWVRNLKFRLIHLAIMAYIAVNAIRGELCFLTYWERDLRNAAGQRIREEAGRKIREDMSFVGRLLHNILFVDVDQRVLHGIYLGLAALLVVGVVLVPPRWRTSRSVRP